MFQIYFVLSEDCCWKYIYGQSIYFCTVRRKMQIYF